MAFYKLVNAHFTSWTDFNETIPRPRMDIAKLSVQRRRTKPVCPSVKWKASGDSRAWVDRVIGRAISQNRVCQSKNKHTLARGRAKKVQILSLFVFVSSLQVESLQKSLKSIGTSSSSTEPQINIQNKLQQVRELEEEVRYDLKHPQTCDQSNKHFKLLIYDSRVVI